LNTPGRRALYNLLKQQASSADARRVAEPAVPYGAGNDALLQLALRIDETVKHNRPDGWRGVQAKENVIKKALYDILHNFDEVERIFLIIRQQTEY
jgi:type I restriction enzyme R subunit